MSKSAIEAGVAAFTPSKMRMDIIDTGKIIILNDAYNACPESILAGMDVLAYGNGRKVAILGDILELDEFAERIHYETGEKVANKEVDLIICCGPLSKAMAEGAASVLSHHVVYFGTQDEMLAQLKDFIQPMDTVLVKASRGLHFEHTVAFLKSNFE